MEIANCAKCFGGRFHGVASERAVHVKIDKTGREIISVKIDNVFRRAPALARARIADRFFLRRANNFEARREFHRGKSNARL